MKWLVAYTVLSALQGRPPRGGRGLKCDVSVVVDRPFLGRPPRGGRGLKCLVDNKSNESDWGRPPRGGRGLKYPTDTVQTPECSVAPLAGGVD